MQCLRKISVKRINMLPTAPFQTNFYKSNVSKKQRVLDAIQLILPTKNIEINPLRKNIFVKIRRQTVAVDQEFFFSET